MTSNRSEPTKPHQSEETQEGREEENALDQTIRALEPISLPFVEKTSTSELKTRYFGTLAAHGFLFRPTGEEVLALSIGDLRSAKVPLVRIHSRCLTGDVFGSVLCECGQQLEYALSSMQAENAGLLIYLEQEGRGNGLLAKLRAYQMLEQENIDTVDAFIRQELPVDNRGYESAVAIMQFLGLRSIRLLTNNPRKLEAVEKAGITVSRERIIIPPNEWNRGYLQTKKLRLGHLLDL